LRALHVDRLGALREIGVVQKLGQLNRKYGKPILNGAMGGPYTQRMAKAIEAVGVPVFQSVSEWVGAARGLAFHTMKLPD
jgi:acyl-CoA synthetase (NDP forming)